jgi:multiple sugar transport system substrate-binding protein
MTAGVAIVAGLGGGVPALAEDVTLTIAVPDWPPTRIMKDLFDRNYKPPSGNKVTLDVDFIPWPDYYTRLNTSLTSGENKYNMAVSDSQWLGAFIEAGYFRKLNDLIDADPGLQAALDSMHPGLVQAYSTYPHKSDNYYGFPQMPDILVNYYRKDVLCNEEEQAGFKAQYNVELPCTPEEMDDIDWDTFEKIGEFFMRKKGDKLAGQVLDDDFYGIAYQAGKSYDMSTSQVHTFIWQHGANIWDETQAPKGHAEGVVNSPEAVKAFDHYLRLTKYMPPVVKDRRHGRLQDRRTVPRR